MPTSAARVNALTGPPIQYPTTLIDVRWLGARRLLLRPVLPQDEGLSSAFLLAQSASARHNRFHTAVNPSPRLCQQMSRVDYRRQLALVVCTIANEVEQLVADARYSVADDGRSAEFALIVDERWQCRGVGAWALCALQQAAARAGVTRLEGEVLRDNQPMLGLARRCGFACTPDPRDERLVRVQRRLAVADAHAAGAAGVHRPPRLLQWLRRSLTARPRSLRRAPPAH